MHNTKELPNIENYANYVLFSEDCIQKGFDKCDILQKVNANFINDCTLELSNDTECCKFCMYWEAKFGWKGHESTFIYRHWKAMSIDVKPTIENTIRDENGCCPSLEIDFGC